MNVRGENTISPCLEST